VVGKLNLRAFSIAAGRLVARSLRSSSRLGISYPCSGAFDVSTDDSEPSGERLLRLLRENQIDLSVVEGLRLVIAFNKISDASDRRALIELAERLAR
jgi:hypothetical protein